MARDCYVILGVAVDATPEQIKQAYRQKALQFHPDHDGPDAEPFLEVQEAYAVLSDRRLIISP
jgi:molecular chaperone DnaJ